MILRELNDDIVEIRKAGDRKREFFISSERDDMHRSVLRMGGWRLGDFNKAGAFYYMHQTSADAFTPPNPDNALGIGTAKIEGNRLVGIGEFEPEELNPLAQKILGKVDFGTYKRTSVGFIPHAAHWGDEKNNENPELRYFTDQTLIEFSIVNIGSNLDAVKKSIEDQMDVYLLSVLDEHKSEGFKKDYRFNLNKLRRQREYLLNLAEKRNFL